MSTIKMIYNSDYDPDDYLEEFLGAFDLSKTDYDSSPKAWEEDLENYILSDKALEYDCNISDIQLHERSHGKKFYVVKAYLGLWDGIHEGGKVIEGMENVVAQCVENCDYFKFFIEGRCMKFTCVHHDGMNNFYVKELTERGERYYNTYKNELSDRELIEKLYEDRHLSKHVTIWNEMYGM